MSFPVAACCWLPPALEVLFIAPRAAPVPRQSPAGTFLGFLNASRHPELDDKELRPPTHLAPLLRPLLSAL